MHLFLSVLLVVSSLAWSSAQSCNSLRLTPARCTTLTHPTCSAYYSITFFPNGISSNSSEANRKLETYQRLFSTLPPESECRKYAQVYLCLAIMPDCMSSVGLPPCRDLCQLVKDTCSILDGLVSEQTDIDCLFYSCSRFPTSGTGCINSNSSIVQNALSVSLGTDPAQPSSNTTPPTPTCPLPNNTFFSDSSKGFAVGWISFWSVLCFISTSLTILTFLLNTTRFEYPWRPVVYLALAFNIHSIAYFFSLALGRGIVTCPNNEFVGSGSVWTWAHTPCILIFIFLYYTMMAAFIWWVVLTVGWFLVSALQWSHEAVSKLAPLFQSVAWILPLLMTISVLAAQAVGADELTGTCFVVNDGSRSSFLALLLGVIVPLILFLLAGLVFLLLGFVGIMRIRAFMQRGGKQQEQQSLEKLMIRIGIFVAVYIIPASVLIGCFVYELVSRASWEPLSNTCSDCSRPNSAVFMVRIFMFLLIGVLTGVWIWSRKTLKSWQQFPGKCGACCRDLGHDDDRDNTPGALSAENAMGKTGHMMSPVTNYSYPDSGLDSI